VDFSGCHLSSGCGLKDFSWSNSVSRSRMS
jgi:hypothetical protein